MAKQMQTISEGELDLGVEKRGTLIYGDIVFGSGNICLAERGRGPYLGRGNQYGRTLLFLLERPGRTFMSREIAKSLEYKVDTVGSSISRVRDFIHGSKSYMWVEEKGPRGVMKQGVSKIKKK